MQDYVNGAKLQEYTDKLIPKLKELFPTTPIAVSLVANMTDTSKVYVYTGSEIGYTAGNWYWYDSTDEEWKSGGVYQSTGLVTDTTLLVAGMAADAKATGDGLADLKTQINGLSDELYEINHQINYNYTGSVAAFVNIHFPVKAGKTYVLTNTSASGMIGNVYSFTGSTQHEVRVDQGNISTNESVDLEPSYDDENLRVYFSTGNMSVSIVDENAYIPQILENVNRIPQMESDIETTSNNLAILINNATFVSTSSGFNTFSYATKTGHKYTFTNNAASGVIGSIYSHSGGTLHQLKGDTPYIGPGDSVTVTATNDDTYLNVYFNLTGMSISVTDDNAEIPEIQNSIKEIGDTTRYAKDDTHFVYGNSELITITVSTDKRTRTIVRTSGTGTNLGCLIGHIKSKYLNKKLLLAINSTAAGQFVGIYLASSSANWATKLVRMDNVNYVAGMNYFIFDVSEIDQQTYPDVYIWVQLPGTDSGCTYNVSYISNIPIIAEMAIAAAGKKSLDSYSWNAVGDSITNQAKYMNIIKDILKIDFANCGVSSSTLAINNAYLQNQSIVERICGLNGNTAYSDSDVWTINGGLNDVLYESTLGSLAATGTTFDNTTVYGALQSIVENIMGRRAHPRLILITPTHSVRDAWSKETYGITIAEIRQAMIDVGEYYGVPVIDMWALGGINAYNAQKQTNPTTSDGVHPTDAGATLMAMPICNAIEEILYDA